jgi:hypothetical protein
MRLKTVILLACLCVLTSCAEVAYAQNQSPRAYGNITASGSSCTTTPAACVILSFPNQQTGASVVSITGTWTATVQFEASSDGGDNWVAINSTPPNSTTAVTSATANGTWQANVAGFTNIRVRCSAFTSGTIVVVINSASVSAKSGGGAVYASGLGTSNVIPKGNGAGQLADSALTDNATNVISTEPFVGPTSNTACMLCVSGAVTSGLAMNQAASGPQVWTIASGARRGFGFDSSGLLSIMSSTVLLGWNSSASDPGGTGLDTNLSRSASGVVSFGTAQSSNSAGTVNAATYQYRGLAQTYFVTSDFTTSGSGTALELITGLSFTFPASTAINAKLDCYLNYNQNVAAVAVAFGFQDATIAPTNLNAWGRMGTNTTVFTAGTLAASATTTATSVVSATPSAITTIWPAGSRSCSSAAPRNPCKHLSPEKS